MLLVASCHASPRERPGRPNVVLITLDTTRADHLGCYGYTRPTSPSLDRLAAESVLYTRAIATSSWTLPSHASLFTGKLTSSHGAEYDPEGPLSLASIIEAPKEWRQYRARGLAESERTLAEILKAAGYETGAVVGGPWLKKPFGLGQGFDYYDDDQIESSNGRTADRVTAAATRWLERTRGRTFLLFLNYFDPHGPYAPPDPFAHAFLEPGTKIPEGIPAGKTLVALYDAEIAFMDQHIGRLLDRLREIGLYDDTLILVTADHGELLEEHGKVGHGEDLYQPEIHVPLFVKYPRREVAPARRADPVQLTDVLPLILDSSKVAVPAGIQGGLPPRVGHPIVAEVSPLPFSSRAGSWRALFDGEVKFLWNSRGDHRLYDLARDPGETTNLASREPERARRMATLLEKYLASLPRPGAAGPPVTLDDETRRALRSLGYVH
jgi:arylsulfatase A-like enzyme